MQSERKIKRLQPLIDSRVEQMHAESTRLAEIRVEKQNLVKSMRESQRRYMEGVERLNQIRSSGNRENLETLESALDYVKHEWQTLFTRVQEVERHERSQISRVLTAERDLKAVEKLRERYVAEHNKEQNRAEQRLLDEHALRRHSDRS